MIWLIKIKLGTVKASRTRFQNRLDRDALNVDWSHKFYYHLLVTAGERSWLINLLALITASSRVFALVQSLRSLTSPESALSHLWLFVRRIKVWSESSVEIVFNLYENDSLTLKLCVCRGFFFFVRNRGNSWYYYERELLDTATDPKAYRRWLRK